MRRRRAQSRLWLLVMIFSGLQCLSQSGSPFDRGLAAFRAGNYSSAVALFAEAEAASPGATDALLYRAKSLIHLDDFNGAERNLRSYLASHPASSDALFTLGFVLHRQNLPAESLAAYTNAARVATPTSDDLKIVGLDYVLLDDYSDAIKWLEKSVSMDPRNVDAWYCLGRADQTIAHIDEARRAFQKVLDLDPQNVKAESNLGLIYEASGEPAAAMEAYRRAIKWQENSLRQSEQPYVDLGNLLMEQGRTSEAKAPLEKAVALAPNNAYCRLTLGIYYHKSGRLADAQQELEQATRLEPENAVAHYQLGRVCKEMHDIEHAQAESDRIQAETDRAQANFDRAQAEFDRAQAQFDRAQAELDRAQAEFERTAEIKSRAAQTPSSTPNH
jgi:tetratricopeptide (TPR) repeat protein